MSSLPPSILQPMIQKLSYWHDLDDADEEAILNLPHRTKRIERQGYIIREREKPRTPACCFRALPFGTRSWWMEPGRSSPFT